jgi:LCP family protein required for cell wall assembly
VDSKYKKLFILAVIIALFSGFLFSLQFAKVTMSGILMKAMPQRKFTESTNILLVGMDKNIDGAQRTDTLMLVNINPYTKHIGLISIPRDTRLFVEGHGYKKINSAYTYGGVKLLAKSLADYLQITIPYYVMIDLNGAGQIIDDLGGVELNVEKRMYYVDHAGDLYIDLQPGRQRLTGSKALQYVRFRGDPDADLSRMKRQQNFIKALANRCMSIGTIVRVPRLIYKFSRHVKTNLSSSQIISLSFKLREAYELNNLEVATLPGQELIMDNISYLEPNRLEALQIVQRLIKGYELIPSPLADLRKPPEISVQILNGNGINRMGINASKKLKKLGYVVHSIGDAGEYNYKHTLLVNWHGERNEDEAYILARKLYIRHTNMITFDNPQKKLDFTLVLGHDWPIER